MKMFRFAVLVLVVSALPLLSCNEQMEAHYASSEQAAADRAFARGLLPEALRHGATNISESHDLDSNNGSASFDYSPSLMEGLEKNCSKIPPTRAVAPASSGWKNLLSKQPTSAQLSTGGVKAYQCGTFVIELETKSNSGVLWQPR